MQTERRTSQRFNIILIIELILSKGLEQTFFGITNNFSYNGLCMETQCSDFEPGEDLEIRLKHPHSDLTVPVTGKVAWKNKADKFAFMTGIKLDEIDMDTRESMLEVMSSAGNVPVNFFLPEQTPDDNPETDGEEEIYDKQIAGQEEELTMKPSMDPEEEDFFTDASEELAENEDPLLVEQEYAGPAAALDTSMEDDKPGHVDATQEELPMPAIHDPEKDTLDNAGRFSTADTFHYKKEIWGRNKWIFLLITVVAAAIVIYALPSMFKDYDAEIPAPASEKTGYIDVDEEVVPESLTPDLPSDGPAIQELPQEIKQQTPGETVNAEVPPEDVTEPARLPVDRKSVV